MITPEPSPCTLYSPSGDLCLKNLSKKSSPKKSLKSQVGLVLILLRSWLGLGMVLVVGHLPLFLLGGFDDFYGSNRDNGRFDLVNHLFEHLLETLRCGNVIGIGNLLACSI